MKLALRFLGLAGLIAMAACAAAEPPVVKEDRTAAPAPAVAPVAVPDFSADWPQPYNTADAGAHMADHLTILH